MLENAKHWHLPEDLLDLRKTRMGRRDILKAGLMLLAVGAAAPFLTAGKAFASADFGARHVSFNHAHTGERFSGVYRVGDKYLPEAFERMNYVLRDFRTGEVFPMDPGAVDIISAVQARTQTGRPLEVLSGYRCPKTNAMLAESTSGVAKNSFHMYGQAIDIRMPDFNTNHLREIATDLKAGGVGYYPKSDFVHVDTGKIRYW